MLQYLFCVNPYVGEVDDVCSSDLGSGACETCQGRLLDDAFDDEPGSNDIPPIKGFISKHWKV